MPPKLTCSSTTLGMTVSNVKWFSNFMFWKLWISCSKIYEWQIKARPKAFTPVLGSSVVYVLVWKVTGLVYSPLLQTPCLHIPSLPLYLLHFSSSSPPNKVGLTNTSCLISAISNQLRRQVRKLHQSWLAAPKAIMAWTCIWSKRVKSSVYTLQFADQPNLGVDVAITYIRTP